MVFSRSGKRPAKSRRRKKTADRGGFLRWARRVAIGMLLVVLVAVGAFLFIRGRAFLYSSDYFEIESVRILGLDHKLSREVADAADLGNLEGRNLFALNTHFVSRRIIDHPQVAEANIVKRYPDALRVFASQRNPAAVVSGENLCLIDREGRLLKILRPEELEAGLPFISGVDLAGLRLGDRIEQPELPLALDLVDRIEAMNPSLYRELGEIVIDEEYGLTLILGGGLEARLGVDNFAERMAALEAFLESHPRRGRLHYIDLRFDGQLTYQ